MLPLTEYIRNYYFYRDGSIEFEIRLTGILNVYIADKDKPSPYGTFVAPGINTQKHQHLFSVRIDPMIDRIAEWQNLLRSWRMLNGPEEWLVSVCWNEYSQHAGRALEYYTQAESILQSKSHSGCVGNIQPEECARFLQYRNKWSLQWST
ncbi:hypothetical protein C0995_001795 [Termitomyces sp. Mi166|nr:hypothetical protein C0995_001795 [Termitomyces sp. Mi166\